MTPCHDEGFKTGGEELYNPSPASNGPPQGRIVILVQPTAIADVLCLVPRIFEDDRGYFFESYNHDVFASFGIACDVVQENQSLSRKTGTVRGLHYQKPPFAQAKVVRVVTGAILDVAVDIRVGSPTFGCAATVELSASNRRQLFVPEGFAHGFITLTEDAEVVYLVNRPYNKACEGGLLWNDPALRIAWRLPPDGPTVNARDMAWPTLAALEPAFHFEKGITA